MYVCKHGVKILARQQEIDFRLQNAIFMSNYYPSAGKFNLTEESFARNILPFFSCLHGIILLKKY